MNVHIHIKVRNVAIKHFNFTIIVFNFANCAIFFTFNFNAFQDVPYGNRDLSLSKHDQLDEPQ